MSGWICADAMVFGVICSDGVCFAYVKLLY